MEVFVKYVEDSGVDFASLSNEEKRKWRANYDNSQKGGGDQMHKFAEQLAENLAKLARGRGRSRSRSRSRSGSRSSRQSQTSRDSSPRVRSKSPEDFRSRLLNRSKENSWATWDSTTAKYTECQCDWCGQMMAVHNFEGSHVIPKEPEYSEKLLSYIRSGHKPGCRGPHDTPNGLMLCRLCHGEFDIKPPNSVLGFDMKTGLRIYKGTNEAYKQKADTKFEWFGQEAFPTATLFEWRNRIYEEVQKDKAAVVAGNNYPALTVQQLKDRITARKIDVQGLSRKRKSELVQILESDDKKKAEAQSVAGADD